MVDTLPDDQLLDRYARTRAEAPFAVLVQRHVDLVHSIALRLTRDAHLAEDVSQEVFVVLARNASALATRVGSGMPLSAWLHTTTRHLAAKQVRGGVRRRQREQVLASMNPSIPGDPDPAEVWSEVAPHLDDGLASLSEGDRRLLLLRFFDRVPAREVGARLGISEEAAQKRLQRALERLQRILHRHVPDLSASGLAALLGVHAVQSAPEALAASLTAVCWKSAAGLSPGPLANVLAHLVMTKTQGWITGAVITAFALPLSYRQLELNRLRAAPVPPPPAVVEASVRPAPEPAPLDESAEMARLRLRRDELQSQIANRAQRLARSNQPAAGSAAGPILLEVGRVVPLTNLVVAGDATPEAAAQTVLARMRDDAIEALMDSFLFSPSERARYAEFREQPDSRDILSERLRSTVTNVLAVELREIRAIDDRRRELVVRHLTGTTTNEQRLIFGNAGGGWKMIP